MPVFLRNYRLCPVFFLAGGAFVATVAYNVMGRTVGFSNLSVMSLIPGFTIGSISGLVISFLVIRNRNLLLDQLAAEQRTAAELKAEIAERRKIEAALQASMEEAEFANRTKSEFLANMGHEIRTPLNAIIGFSDALREQVHGPVGDVRYLDYLNDIGDAGRHLFALLGDILTISQIETGESKLRESEIRVRQLFGACLLLARERAAKKNITLIEDLSAAPDALLADEQKLKQILMNLLSNSIKFTPDGGTVTIRCRRDGASCLLQVEDTGIGMAPEDIPVALTPFRQIDGSLGRKYEGTGLGLALCKSLAELHGGEIGIESAAGTGTTVTVRLPATRIVEHRLAG
jgi:two-component system cell cycle sensor histidine kinase PleC